MNKILLLAIFVAASTAVVATTNDEDSSELSMSQLIAEMKATNTQIYKSLEGELSPDELAKYKKRRDADVNLLEAANEMGGEESQDAANSLPQQD